jgi:hypothetical protein
MLLAMGEETWPFGNMLQCPVILNKACPQEKAFYWSLTY